MFDFSIYMVTIKKYKIVLNYYSRTKYVQYIIKVGNLKVETDGPHAALQFIMYSIGLIYSAVLYIYCIQYKMLILDAVYVRT